MTNRRDFLALSATTALYLLTGCGDNGDSGSDSGIGEGGTLPIPKLMTPTIRSGVAHYDLDIIETEHTFFSGIKTKTWGVNSSYLGPTLLLQRGTEVSINYSNRLSVETTMHGHGMHVPGNMDGSAHQPIGVGSTWSARYVVNQKACTNWYHPHYLHQTAPHVYQGLAGLIIVEDEEIRSIDLPNRYGVDDIPLVLQDRVFSSDKKSIVYAPNMMQLANGYIGDTFITNGAIEPTVQVEAKEVRFRLLNGSNSTVYQLGFSDGRNFLQIASDNGLLERPVSMNGLTLSPGERAEIVVDFTNNLGESVSLQEYRYSKTFLNIQVSKESEKYTTVPPLLTTLEAIPSPTRRRKFVLGMGGMNGGMGGMGRGMTFTINGQTMDVNRIDASLSRGVAEEWEVVNSTGMNHNFHVHGTYFRVISRNNDPEQVLDNEKGYKDVVFIPPLSSVKLVIQFPNDLVTADSSSPFMFHCHFLEHEDNGMMGQFTVS